MSNSRQHGGTRWRSSLSTARGAEFDAEPDTPLLWVLREQLGLTGTKYGCGVAQCGACTVHIDGVPTRTCVLPVSTRRARAQKIVDDRRPVADGIAPAAEGLGRARRAAMRLLPVRHDHGGGGAAQGQAEADRCRHRRGDDQHLPLRHLQPRARRDQGRAPAACQGSRACDPARRREHDMTDRRLAAPVPRHVGRRGRRPGRRHSTFRSPARASAQAQRRRAGRDQRLGRRQARRHGRDPHRALRDGPGHAHRPRAARRRGARLRLGQGDHRIPDARRRTSRATASGATSPPAAAAASASRRNTCARAARPRG